MLTNKEGCLSEIIKGEHHAEAEVKDDDKYVFFVILVHAYTLMCLKWMGNGKSQKPWENIHHSVMRKENNGSVVCLYFLLFYIFTWFFAIFLFTIENFKDSTWNYNAL